MNIKAQRTLLHVRLFGHRGLAQVYVCLQQKQNRIPELLTYKEQFLGQKQSRKILNYKSNFILKLLL